MDAQKRIASVLGALDDKIALNQQINEFGGTGTGDL